MFKKIGIAAALCLTMGMTVGCTSLSNVDEEANIAESIEKIAEDVAGEASSEAATEVSSEDTDDESAKEASEADEKSSEAATSASSKASVKDAASKDTSNVSSSKDTAKTDSKDTGKTSAATTTQDKTATQSVNLGTPKVKDGEPRHTEEAIEIVFTWDPVEGADGYEVDCQSKFKDSNEYKPYKKWDQTTTYFDTKEPSYVASTQDLFDFMVKVRAYKDVEGVRSYGDWSNAATGNSYFNIPAISNVSGLPEAFKGTWMTASVGYEYYGEVQPRYYVQFTDTQINYCHKKDGEFVTEYSDKICSIQEIGNGTYRIQAKTADGAQYTYQTGGSEEIGIEYFGTWEEEAFDSTYSGGSSLSVIN